MLAALLIAILPGVVPLDAADRAQLEAVVDGAGPLEGPGLETLLSNVARWQPGDESGAQVPDYDALLADPAAQRGELMLIEGRFAGRPRSIPLSHAGEWGGTLTEWGLIVRDDPELVAMVYLVDQPSTTPVLGQRVRIAARFYKLWQSDNLHGQPTTFPTFIARQPRLLAQDDLAPTSRDGGANLAFWAVVLAAAFAFAIWRLTKLTARPKPLPTRVQHDRDPPEPAINTGLPTDPAEALDELHRRHDEDAVGRV